jgi:hypothetical protein
MKVVNANGVVVLVMTENDALHLRKLCSAVDDRRSNVRFSGDRAWSVGVALENEGLTLEKASRIAYVHGSATLSTL